MNRFILLHAAYGEVIEDHPTTYGNVRVQLLLNFREDLKYYRVRK